MRQKNSFSISILLMGLILVFANSCKKDDDPQAPASSFTDSRDNTVYQIVTIGNQVWMAENLKYLPSVVGPGTGSETPGSETTPYYYVYDYNGTDVAIAKATENYKVYGVVYFTAFPGGYRYNNGEFMSLNDYGMW